MGYSGMLAAAIRGEFDILVAEDISRLWRNMEMQTRDINELLELRISVVTQAEDTRRENDLMMLNLKGSMNENNRKEIGRRVRNKMELLAKNGRPAGGRAYGWRAASWSGKTIAQELNTRKVPAPGAAWNRNHSARNPKRPTANGCAAPSSEMSAVAPEFSTTPSTRARSSGAEAAGSAARATAPSDAAKSSTNQMSSRCKMRPSRPARNRPIAAICGFHNDGPITM